MRHGNRRPKLFGNLQKLIGFGERLRKWFFDINVRANRHRGFGHRQMLIARAWSDAHELRHFTLQHLAITGVLPKRLAALPGLLAAFLIRISHGNDEDVVKVVEDLIEAVTVIPASSMADDRGAKLFRPYEILTKRELLRRQSGSRE